MGSDDLDEAATVAARIPVSESNQDKPEKETGGRDGPDPTRFGDWEKNGRCIDF